MGRVLKGKKERERERERERESERERERERDLPREPRFRHDCTALKKVMF